MMSFLFVIILSVFVQGHAYASLIVCNSGCGCVTDTGVSVSCDFSDESATTIIQAKIQSEGWYQAEHVISLGTSFIADGHMFSKSVKCPKVAGKPSSGKCTPTDVSKKSAEMPIANGEVMEEDIGNRSGELMISMGQENGNGILRFEIGDKKDEEGKVENVGRQATRVPPVQSRAVGGFSNCRPRAL